MKIEIPFLYHVVVTSEAPQVVVQAVVKVVVREYAPNFPHQRT
jgi:hypothetical protein